MKYKKLSTSYISSFCMELYLIMQAGIPLPEGMEMLSQSESDGDIRQMLTGVTDTLVGGEPLYIALEGAQSFPRYMVDMIRVGEETGNLDRGLKGLATYYDRQEQLENSVRRAVLYPAILLTMLMLVLGVLIAEVLPMFNDVYAQLGGTLTGLGGAILDLGALLHAHWAGAIVVAVVVVAVVVLVAIRGRRDGRRVLLSKRLGLAVATAKLASALAMALQSGLDTDRAIELAETLTQHPALRQKVSQCRHHMEEGENLATALCSEGVFSPLYCRMLEVGNRTGAMDEVMEDIARRSDTSAQDAVERYVGSVEPTLVMVMSVLVGVVLLSVMIPLANIMTALG